MQLAHLVVIGLQLGDIGGGTVIAEQLGTHTHGARGIGHIDHRALVMRADLHRGVHAAAGGAPDQQRDLLHAEVVVALHLGGHMLHLFQAGRDQACSGPRSRRLLTSWPSGQDVLAAVDHDAHGRRPRSCCTAGRPTRCSCRCRGRRLSPSRCKILALALDVGANAAAGNVLALLFFHDKASGSATAFFMTRALFTTCGRNILPSPKRPPTTVHAVHQRAFDDVQRATAQWP